MTTRSAIITSIVAIITGISWMLSPCSSMVAIRVLVGATVWKYSRSAAISLLLLAGSGVMEVYYGNALRQSLAMAVFLFAFYRYIPKRQYWCYELWMIAAVSLHEVAAAAMLVPIVAEYVHKHPEKLLKKFIIACIRGP